MQRIWLKDLRKRTNLTQREIGGVLGVTSGQFVSNLERGLAPIPHAVIKKYVKVLCRNKKDEKKIAEIFVFNLVKEFELKIRKSVS